MRRLLEHVLGPPLAPKTDRSRIYRARGRNAGPWMHIYRPFTHPLPFIGAQVDEAQRGWGYAVSGGVGLGGDRPGIGAVVGWRSIPWDRVLEPAIGRGESRGRLVVSVVLQGSGAPVIDGARATLGNDQCVAQATGVVVRIRPTAGPGLFLGVLGAHRIPPVRRWWPAALFGARGDQV